MRLATLVLAAAVAAALAACSAGDAGSPASPTAQTTAVVASPAGSDGATSTASGPSTPGAVTTPGATPGGPAPAGTPTTPGLAPLARSVVAKAASGSVASLQALADDLADGNTSAIVRQCWTMAPQRLERELFAQRQAVLAALTRANTGTERGMLWGTDRDAVFVAWDELSSSYACPQVRIGGQALPLQHYDATLIFQRLDGQLRGQPLRPSDSLAAYPLLCDTHNLGTTPGQSADARPATAQIDPRLWPLIRRMATEPLRVSGTGEVFTVTSSSGVVSKVVKHGGFCVEQLRG